MSRNVGIAVTIITVLCCACPGLFLCVFGGLIGAGVPLTTTLNDVSVSQTLPASYGVGLICLSIILILIPIVVVFVTLRSKKPVVENESVVVPPP
jgi:uncharacterized membrane protein